MAQPVPASELPLVSCLMPTADRADFVEQSIRFFRRQSYPRRELVIVDDGSDDLEARLPDRPWLRYHKLDRRWSIGAKRNLACELVETYGTDVDAWMSASPVCEVLWVPR